MDKMTVTNTVYNISIVRKILKFIVQQFLNFLLFIAVDRESGRKIPEFHKTELYVTRVANKCSM